MGARASGRFDRVRRMEEYRPFWIEEPFKPDDYGKYAALAAAVDTPIAGGEEETTLADFERLIEELLNHRLLERSGETPVRP